MASKVMRVGGAGAREERVTVRIVRPCVVEGTTFSAEDVEGGVEVELPSRVAKRLMSTPTPQAVPAGKQTRAGGKSKGDDAE